MKRNNVLPIFLLIPSLLGVISCNSNNDDNKDPLEPYKLIYNGTSKKIHNTTTKDETIFNRASYAYRFNTEQGYNGWTLSHYNNGQHTNLVNVDGVWTSGKNTLNNDGIISAEAGTSIAYSYQVQDNAKYAFGGTIQQFESDKGLLANITVLQNNVQIFPKGNLITTTIEDEAGRYFEGLATCNKGDTITFLVTGDNVYCNPVIRKGHDLEDTLYNTHNDWGYYGDIHCFYHDDKLHLYHLWNTNWTDAGWFWNMQTTTDMFRYENGGYDESFIHDHYMAYGKTPDVVDYSIYMRARDCTTFYDEEVNKYRSIGLGYISNSPGNVRCDLFLRTSDDGTGLSWTTNAIPLKQFHNSGEPECSQLIKIGNRWYLCTGISGQSVHGVGTMTYWFGEEGQTIDEIDWLNLEPHKIDGEDLAVPQIEKVRDKHYLFGWMPQNPTGSNWGGYKNLPREVYQKSDGTLGTRIDPMATKLLNKGKLFDINPSLVKSNNSTVETNHIHMHGQDRVDVIGKVGQSFVKFDVEMISSNEFYYVLNDGATDYRIAIEEREDGNAYLRIYTEGNRTWSEVYLSEVQDKYECKIVCHGSIIEFAVNNTIVLSGRTNSRFIDCTPGFAANGETIISNISINRLAQLYDVYD